MGLLSTIDYDCEVSPQQLNEIYQAMLDRSEEPVTETFIAYTEIEDSDGNIFKNPTETTMTDSKFNVTWSKISAQACQTKINEPNKNDIKQMTEDFSNFSESFMSSLQKCQPAEETKTLLLFNETVKIIGLKDNFCQLQYKSFELSLPIAMLSQITSFTELKKQLSNTEYSRYLPDYSSQALLFELDRCAQHQKTHQGVQETSQNE